MYYIVNPEQYFHHKENCTLIRHLTTSMMAHDPPTSASVFWLQIELVENFKIRCNKFCVRLSMYIAISHKQVMYALKSNSKILDH